MSTTEPAWWWIKIFVIEDRYNHPYLGDTTPRASMAYGIVRDTAEEADHVTRLAQKHNLLPVPGAHTWAAWPAHRIERDDVDEQYTNKLMTGAKAAEAAAHVGL
jgi:hypothetical protein